MTNSFSGIRTLVLATGSLVALQSGAAELVPDDPIHCQWCAAWNEPREPFRVYGNTYYVGTAGLSAMLVTSDDGHVLIDGALPQSAPLIASSIESLGFRLENVRLIVNSHAHYDHAGGIAALRRASGATVAASPASAEALRTGRLRPSDPQFGLGREESSFPPVAVERVLADGESIGAGDVKLTAHFTPGHTPGGTSWSWRSCEEGRCLDMVYGDSLTAVSAPGFSYSDSGAGEALHASIETIRALPCDVLVVTHPDNIDLDAKYQSLRAQPDTNPFIQSGACANYAEQASSTLEQRLESERFR